MEVEKYHDLMAARACLHALELCVVMGCNRRQSVFSFVGVVRVDLYDMLWIRYERSMAAKGFSKLEQRVYSKNGQFGVDLFLAVSCDRRWSDEFLKLVTIFPRTQKERVQKCLCTLAKS